MQRLKTLCENWLQLFFVAVLAILDEWQTSNKQEMNKFDGIEVWLRKM